MIKQELIVTPGVTSKQKEKKGAQPEVSLNLYEIREFLLRNPCNVHEVRLVPGCEHCMNRWARMSKMKSNKQ